MKDFYIPMEYHITEQQFNVIKSIDGYRWSHYSKVHNKYNVVFKSNSQFYEFSTLKHLLNWLKINPWKVRFINDVIRNVRAEWQYKKSWENSADSNR